jgi:hypothetical protein
MRCPKSEKAFLSAEVCEVPWEDTVRKVPAWVCSDCGFRRAPRRDEIDCFLRLLAKVSPESPCDPGTAGGRMDPDLPG